MKVGIYGKNFDTPFDESIKGLLAALHSRGHEVIYFKKIKKLLEERRLLPDTQVPSFSSHTEVADCDLFISVGGDGTLLDTLQYIRDREIPVLGINTGRLGFLSNIGTEEIDIAIEALENEDFVVDERIVIEVKGEAVKSVDFPFALNEVTVHKKDDASMVTVHAHMNDRFINTYWADGLIVATPTGSTAYSLSCGGPIVMPGSKNFILTPIAPHNLNVRPLVVPNNHSIILTAEGRADEYLLTLDSYSYPLKQGEKIELSTASFVMRLLNLREQHFFQTIRKKMLWGIDRRN